MIRFEPTSRMAEITVPDGVEMNWISAEQSNSSVIVGDIAIIKMFRRVTDGPHPEAEMGRHLTEQGFANTPALVGRGRARRSRRHAPCAGHRPSVRPQPGRRLDLDAGPAAARPVRHHRATKPRRATPAATPTTFVSPSCSASGSARCTWCSPARHPTQPSPPLPEPPKRRRPSQTGRASQLEAAYRAVDAVQQWEAAAEQDHGTMQAAREALFAELPALADGGRRGDADPHPRRPASGPDPGRQRRRFHHRFRR